MKYNVAVNEKSKTVTVTLADGSVGVAKCCETDQFNLSTGIELALERAKVAKANAEKAKEIKPTPMATQMTVTMLAKQLEKTLPKGQIIVAVGGGDHCLTEQGKKWLAGIAGVSAKCGCPCCNCDEEDTYENGYEDGYEDGLADGKAEVEESGEEIVEKIVDTIRNILNDAIIE
jgi:hypothetical protein